MSPQLPAPGEHGGDGALLARALGLRPEEILDLSATLNPLAPDVTAVVRKEAAVTARYPEASAATGSLADAIGVARERLLLTNGGAEAISLVAAEMAPLRVVEPEFSLWRRHLGPAGLSPDPSRRVRSNPNNPTGLLAGLREKALVWDEAFYQLTTGCWTRGDADEGSTVVGSLTKLFACPGLRLGYALCPDGEVRERLAARQPAWSVNGLALAVLPHLLAAARLGEWREELASLREELVGLLTTAGLEVAAGTAPWVLVHRAGFLRPALARHGVLVRDCSSFGLPDTVRLAVPGPAGMRRLANALAACLEDSR